MTKPNNKGATLTEVIVTMALIVIILSPISLLFYNGYSNYFIENDKMNAAQASREVVQKITEDLRRYEDDTLNIIAFPNQLQLKFDSGSYEVTYLYDDAQKDILRNGTSIFYDEEIIVENFNIQETVEAGQDTSIIEINCTIHYGRHGEEIVETFYRRKYPLND